MARSSPSTVALEQTPPRGRASGRPTAWLLLVSMRPEQWTKNLLVFAGLVFSRRLGDVHSVLLAAAAFAIFCALSAAVYLVNDAWDRESDRYHPLKSARPVASGSLAPITALIAAGLVGSGALGAAVALRPAFAAAAAVYLALLFLYSALLKHVVILDVLTVAAGFVLRAVAGAVVIAVPISHWLLVCTTLLAVFLALSKRRHELTLLVEGAIGHRPILEEYNPYLLDQMVSVVTASALISYTLYATSQETAERIGTDWLVVTIPFVLYGIFRYLYLVHTKRSGGNPSTLWLTDRPLLACVALWIGSVIVILYSPLGH